AAVVESRPRVLPLASMTNHLRLISFPLGMVVDIRLFTPWFCRLQCSAWCMKKDGSNMVLTTMLLTTSKLVTAREAPREHLRCTTNSMHNEALPHGSTHKALK